MTTKGIPAHRSRPCAKNLWNDYRIYEDRIVLRCRFLLRTFVIPKEHLISIGIFEPPVLTTNLWALKLDLADVWRHVGITRRSGWFKDLRFTPADPETFVTAARKCFGLEAYASPRIR